MPLNRTVVVLTLAQCFAQCGAPIVVLVGGIVGSAIAPVSGLATLPIAIMIVGTALTTVPAALFMQRFGRKTGFMVSACCACAAGVLAAFSIRESNFWLFCVATLLVGSNVAFVQQYRFAVAESVAPERVGPAVSVLMMAGVVAAFLGPEVANRLHAVVDWGAFSGSFFGLSGLMFCALVCLGFYRDGSMASSSVDQGGRSIVLIATNPLFLLAVGSAVVGYAVMSFIMTATPVSMHATEHFSLDETTLVIQSHIVAMFLPSLFSGLLISRFGARNIIAAGLAVLFVCLGIAWMDRQLFHYWLALVLLGVGWNFLFVGGTTLLTTTYRTAERFRVQALNDFLIFGLQALAALGSGVVLSALGWHWILGLSLPWLVLLLPVFWIARRNAAVTA